MGSLLHFLWALVWAVGIFVAVAGYGAGLLRGLRVSGAGFGMAAVVGFAPVILIGGVLNLLHLIRVPVLVGFVVVGVGVAWWLRGELRASGVGSVGVAGKIALGLLVVVSAVRMAATVHNPYYQPQDDLNFYLAAPEKMIQMHWFAADPYSERRITASIGGNQFLTTLVLATQPMESEAMADWTLGAFLLLAVGFAVAREFELTAMQGAVFVLLLMVMPQIRMNLTFVVLPSALFLGLVYLAAHRGLTRDHPGVQTVLMGGTVGAIASMKSNYITHGVIFVLCLGALRWWMRGGRAARILIAGAAVGCLVTMMPWMVASKAASGTWFYPLLGKGFHFSAYGQYLAPIHFDWGILLRKVLPFNLPILVLGGLELLACEREERSYSLVTFTFAAFVASILVGMATGGDSLRRYNFPCVLMAVCLCFILCARRANVAGGATGWRWVQAGAGLMIAAVAVDLGLNPLTNEYARTGYALRASLTDFRLTNVALRERYARVEQAIPPGGGVLATTLTPFLFDFGQRDILLADYPGDASPKPGWPAKQGGDALAEFLLQHDVRYLVYSYGECGLREPFRSCAEILAANDAKAIADPTLTALVRGETESGYDARRQYGELARSRRHVYDDGKIYVLDLAERD